MSEFTREQAIAYLLSHGWEFYREQGHPLFRCDEYTRQNTGGFKAISTIPRDGSRLRQRAWLEHVAKVEGRAPEAVLADMVGGDEVTRLRAEVERLTEAIDEREADMHLRIRAGYDKTVADVWRAEVVKKDAEIASLAKERDEARWRQQNAEASETEARRVADARWADITRARFVIEAARAWREANSRRAIDWRADRVCEDALDALHEALDVYDRGEP